MPNWILGNKFDTIYPHKGSIKTLWETRWKFAVGYPLITRRSNRKELTYIIVSERSLSFS